MDENDSKPKVILGPFKTGNVGSISLLNTVFKNNIIDKYDVIPFYTDRNKGNTSLSEFNFRNVIYFLKQNLSLIHLVRRVKPDIFHFSLHSYWSMEKSLAMIGIAKFFGAKKTIAHLHGGSFEKFWTEMHPIRKKRARKLFKNVDLILVASTYWKEFFKKHEFPNQTHIVNNPINEDFVNSLEKVKSTKRNKKFLFIGSLGERKGTYDLLKVAEENKSFSLILIGNSEKRGDFEKISRIIEEKQLRNIELIKSDRLALDDKVRYFSECGCFIFPSYIENFPLVIIEAAAAQMPIITTRVGAIPEFFKDKQDVLFVEAGDIAQINDAIDQIQNSDELAEFLGNNARQVYLNKLHLSYIIDQLDEGYQKVLS
ncbi:MAG: glycosyltransferase family 4 protein [Nonlabens sp.]